MTEKAKKRRKEIVLAVFNHVPSVIFEQCTIKDLCEIAGISIGTFYHYFEDKSSFFSQLYVLVDDYLTEKLPPLLTGEDILKDLALFCTCFAKCATELGTTTLKSVYTAWPSLSDEIDRARPLYTIPYELLDKARKMDFIIDVPVDELTASLLVLLRGYSYDWSRRSSEYDLIDTVQRAVAIFIRGIHK